MTQLAEHNRFSGFYLWAGRTMGVKARDDEVHSRCRRYLTICLAVIPLSVLVLFLPGTVWATDPPTLTVNLDGGGTVTVDTHWGSATVQEDQNGDLEVILENSEILVRWARRDYDGGLYQETVIRELVAKDVGENQAGCDDLGMSWYGSAEGRGLLTDAQVIHFGPDRITVRLEWNERKGIQEVSIFPDSTYVQVDYIKYGVNIVDIGCPGYSRTYEIYGAGDWIREYVEYPESYYNRYPGDGINDPVDGGSLNYNGSFIMGLHNSGNGHGYGRVMPVAAIPIIKLLPWHGKGFEVFPYYQQGHQPFTGYIYVVTGGAAEIITAGQALADGQNPVQSYQYGDVAELTATAYTGWTFAGWSGDLMGSTNPATLTLTGDTTVTATFAVHEAVYAERFETYAAGADPDDWLDTGADSSLVEDDTLFEVFDLGGEKAFGTASTQANIHSHYVGSLRDTFLSHYQYSGRMMMTAADGGIGVTFFSDYPSADAYYRLRRYGSTSFHISPHGTTVTSGTTDTGVIPESNVWYRFMVEVEDTGIRTEIRAKVWPDGTIEPTKWQADAYDDSITRLTAGTIGVWSFASGSKYWDDLAVHLLPPSGVRSLTVTTVGNGAAAVDPDQPEYSYGQVVTLTATADPGWTFSRWSGGLSGADNPATTVITGHTAVTATFTQDEYTLTVDRVGDGSVAVDPSPGPYHYDDVVTLTATADPGWTFSGWSGGLSGADNPATTTIMGPTVVTATFTQDGYTLTVDRVGHGSVAVDPSLGSYHYDDVVTLTATADPGWAFSGWSGGLSGPDNPATTTITGPTVVTATFTQDGYTLTVDRVGDGSVAVEPSPGPYYYGDVVTLTATADSGWTFSGWSGGLSGADNPATTTITGHTTVTATFTQDEYTLTVGRVGDGSVAVDPSPGPYRYGDVVTLTATADPGWTFSGWSGGLSGVDNPATTTVIGDTTVTATFTTHRLFLPCVAVHNSQ
jgi:hypothetical protein